MPKQHDVPPNGSTEDLGVIPLVSVVVPVYNAEAWLHECLDSVLAQTLQEFEVVCINDGSRDGSAAILEGYRQQEPRVRVFAQENGGLAAARNHGLRVARGAWVHFLDADDTIEPQALEVLVREATDHDLDILLFDGSAIYDPPELEEQFPHFRTLYRSSEPHAGVQTGQDMFEHLSDSRDYRPSACLYLSSMEHLRGNDLLFNEGMLYEDTIFTLRNLFAAQRVMHVGHALYNRRVRPDSIVTRPPGADNFKSYLRCTCEMLEMLCHGQLHAGAARALEVRLRNTNVNAWKIYEALTPEVRKEVRPLPGTVESVLFRMHIVHRKDLKAAEAESRRLARQLTRLKSSRTVRIGRAITWLPRALRRATRKLHRTPSG